MKQLMNKTGILLLFLFIPVFSVLAQDRPATEKKPVANDSINVERQRQINYWKAERLKKETKAREKFFSSFYTLNPDSVTYLNMRYMNLDKLPDLSRFYRLKKIDASGNHIKYFRKHDFRLDSLETVILSGNPVKRVCFPGKSNIEIVVMNDCNLKRIPCSVRKLKSINSFEFTKNHIKRVPSYFRKRKALSEVNLNYNQIKFNNKVVKRLGGIKRILLAGNKIETLPVNINQMKRVKKMNLADNEISDVPASMGEMDSLETIIFYKNRFTQIPDEIFTLSNLRELDFYYNSLTSIPDRFSRLPNLTRIYLSFNNLTSLPKSLSSLKNLKFLYVHHNKLSIIPSWVTALPGLTILDAGYNHLISIPDLSNISTLEEVDLQSNNLEDIPWKLLGKPGLKRIYLRENPFIKDSEDLEQLKKLVKNKAAKGVNIYIE